MKKKYSRISTEMNQLIIDFYLNDENVYTCPGKREYVSTVDENGKKIFLQKKLLLYTVHDLYLKFKNEYSGIEKIPSFSHWMSLKPKECIHAGDPGSHYICVCDKHQNVKLKLSTLSRKLNYRDLLNSAVCDIDSENCMTGDCQNCPREAGVKKAFEDLVNELEIEIKNGQIKYKKWVDKGSAASLENFTVDSDEFLSQLFEDIVKLTGHHFIADTQKRYLSGCKSNLPLDTCIILMDFSENYSFIIQQSVQAFYYNNSQATLHPFCIYFRKPGTNELINVNYCVISDSTDHFAYSINAFTAKIMEELQGQYSWIKKVIYFSDGAPQQYKNK